MALSVLETNTPAAVDRDRTGEPESTVREDPAKVRVSPLLIFVEAGKPVNTGVLEVR